MWAWEVEFSLLVSVSLSYFKIPGAGFKAFWGFKTLWNICRYKLKLCLPNRESKRTLSYTISQENPSSPQEPRMAKRNLEKFLKENQEMSYLLNRNMNSICIFKHLE